MENEKMNNTVLQVYNVLLNRARIAAMAGVGKQYGGDRNIYSALGYPNSIDYKSYWQKYIRMDIASTIINRPANDTWRGVVNVFDPDSTEKKTDNFRWAYQELDKALGLKAKFNRLDKLSAIGRYGILLLGFNDVQGIEGWKAPVQKADSLKLLYVTPYSEAAATIKELEKDPKSPRYGKPQTYQITPSLENSNGVSLQIDSFDVHYSRVIHVCIEPLESDVFGSPVLENVYNRLMDLEKLVGGSAEMFWRGARPGVTADVKEGFDVANPTQLTSDLEDQMLTFEHGLRRILYAEGLELKTLQQQYADPAGAIDAQLTMISIATGIPKRILQGSERGELASTTDADTWYGRVQARREEFAETQVIRPFVDCMITYGILEKPSAGYYSVEWQPLYAQSAKEQAEVARLRTESLAAYSSSMMASSIIPPDMFMKHFLGLNEDVVLDIQNSVQDSLNDIEITETDITETNPEEITE
jgi:uncharacterized protein